MSNGWQTQMTTALLVLADGTVIEGQGLGAEGSVAGEICFNTALTGYQEILTDPSYHDQIVTFTFPHIGNVGANAQDVEDLEPQRHLEQFPTVEQSETKTALGAVGAIFKAGVTASANYRAEEEFAAWLERRGIIAISDIDTRALTSLLREKGALNAVIAHSRQGQFDIEALKKQAALWSGLEGLDLASKASARGRGEEPHIWREGEWQWGENEGYRQSEEKATHIVVIDYGIKRNILRLLAARGARLSIVGANCPASEILALNPDGIFLSNGPGDPAATALIASPIIRALIDAGLPIFGICLGHQLLALSLGGQTVKMLAGHHGANHPVKDFTTGKVEIVSMNHGFAVDRASLPAGVEETHISLFDGSNCGICLTNKPVFSVQHHPEAAPGPQDSHYLFDRFFEYIVSARENPARV